MASKKQIAANRRNVRNSTGPKTIAGKKRASRNALRHGLASQGLRTIEAERIEQLACQIAGKSGNRIVLERPFGCCSRTRAGPSAAGTGRLDRPRFVVGKLGAARRATQDLSL
jgi:hypothetical protein